MLTIDCKKKKMDDASPLPSTMDLFHISAFLSSGSCHSWVNLKSSEWESTTDIFFCIPIYLNC